ncbi:hypothetical protein [Nioella sp.]|uniref:hypothetical protein n=1 Tax=Nioella sp. TaxID=1912091 RepID=UPI003B522344
MSEPAPIDGGTPQMKAIAVVCGALAFAAGSAMSSGFGGFDPAAFPYPVEDLPLTPAGYAFSIWGVIFIALILNAFYGLIKRDTDAGWDATRWPLFVTQAIGAAWIGIAQVSPVMATITIWIMLAGSLMALRAGLKTPETWWMHVPLALLAGWLTAASWVALTTTLVGYTALSPVAGSWIGLAGALLTALAMLRVMPQPAYAIAAIWALVGVIVANLGGSTAFVAATGAGVALLVWEALRGIRIA